MVKFIRYHDGALPAPVNSSSNSLENIIERMHKMHPSQTSFLTVQKIRSVTHSISSRLMQLHLPPELHKGAVLKYIERAGNTDALVRPVVIFEIRFSNRWMLTKIHYGNHFLMEPLTHGLRLTSAQQALVMRFSIAECSDQLRHGTELDN